MRLDFMLFCGLDLFALVPDATTHCRFRAVSTMIF
ncbi:MAG: transposase [Rhodobacteraceae bacterium]|nr:transposase [Paracoccaceae bacterium]